MTILETLPGILSECLRKKEAFGCCLIWLTMQKWPASASYLFKNTLCIYHRWASTSILMSAISDIDICYSDIGDKYVRLQTVIPISGCSDIDIRVHSDVRHSQNIINASGESNPRPLRKKASAIPFSCHTSPQLRGMSDIGYRIKLHSDIDIMSDSALSVRYRRFRYQAQSDIADYGYRTKCPPMVFTIHFLMGFHVWLEFLHPYEQVQ